MSTRVVTFNVTVVVDPEAYGQEYGDERRLGVLVTAAKEHAFATLVDRMREPVEYDGKTIRPSFEAYAGWAKLDVSGVKLEDLHSDGLRPGERNPYDTDLGLFKALCKCGLTFYGDDPSAADSLMMDHAEEANAEEDAK